MSAQALVSILVIAGSALLESFRNGEVDKVERTLRRNPHSLGSFLISEAKVAVMHHPCLGLIRPKTASPRLFGGIARMQHNELTGFLGHSLLATALAGQAFPRSQPHRRLSPLPSLSPSTRRAKSVHRSRRQVYRKLGHLRWQLANETRT